MARNGSGTYSLPAGNPVVTGTTISSTTHNNTMSDLATALTDSIAKDGQTTPTANLPMGTFRHTGVGNASARTDYAAAGQVQDGKLNWADGGGTADAITATYSPAITALVDGQLCYVRATAANATTTPTFAPSGLTARTIVKGGGQALLAGDIYGDGHELELRYDLGNTRWELLNPAKAVGRAASGANSDITSLGNLTSVGAVTTIDINGGTLDGVTIGGASRAAASVSSLTSTGSVLVDGASGLIGYGTGAGGTVTQTTSKATAVTLNKPTGRITLHNAALAANTSVNVQCNNTLVTAADTVDVVIVGGAADFTAYSIAGKFCTANQFNINFRNISGGSLSEAVELQFTVKKGATA